MKCCDVEFGEFTFDGWEFGFGDLSQEDEGQVEVFGGGRATLGKLDGLCEAVEGLG